MLTTAVAENSGIGAATKALVIPAALPGAHEEAGSSGSARRGTQALQYGLEVFQAAASPFQTSAPRTCISSSS